jgi:hypothetical protein
MIKCPSCGKSHPENTLFCDECGAYVLAEGQKRTDPLATDDVRWMDAEIELDESFGASDLEPLKVRALILDSGRQIELTMNKEINIGRLDATSATFPEIDLTEDEGMSKGVSRRHAKITRKGSSLFLEDLGSLNGTFLNGRRLTPYLPHALNDQDEIRLSKLSLTIHFDQD